MVQNGVRMVASVNSFLQEQVYYYEYKNLIFEVVRNLDMRIMEMVAGIRWKMRIEIHVINILKSKRK